VAEKLLKGHVHRLLVTRGAEVVGILSTSDLLGLLLTEEPWR
jgi:CBS domain-containing protein